MERNAVYNFQMNKSFFYCFLYLTAFCSCNDSKWETIDGSGIGEEPKDIEQAIYFEDERNGLVGGYIFSDHDIPIPVAYITADGGKKWKELRFDSLKNARVRDVYLHDDSLVCKTDSTKLISLDRGKSFTAYKDSLKIYSHIRQIKRSASQWFEYKGRKYLISDRYDNRLASVIICSDNKTLNDFYFVSFDKGKNWSFVQKELGDDRAKYLLGDKYLYRYHHPLGLQRLRLK